MGLNVGGNGGGRELKIAFGCWKDNRGEGGVVGTGVRRFCNRVTELINSGREWDLCWILNQVILVGANMLFHNCDW